MVDATMSEKFDKFKAALEALCREHDVCIASAQYDSPAVYDGRISDSDSPVAGLADMTGPNMDGK
jgi:hypothetical protein